MTEAQRTRKRRAGMADGTIRPLPETDAALAAQLQERKRQWLAAGEDRVIGRMSADEATRLLDEAEAASSSRVLDCPPDE